MYRRIATSVVLFDLYNTLVSIETDAEDEEVWARLATFIRYHDVDISPEKLRREFSAATDRGIEASSERYHQTNELKNFEVILAQVDRALAPDELAGLAKEAVLFFRTMTIRRFELFPDTVPALESLSRRFVLGVVTDAQRVFVEPEMKYLGIWQYFKEVIVSGDYDVHKPDPRLFLEAMDRLGVPPEATTFVGDNALRDIGGAKDLKLHAVLLDRRNTFTSDGSSARPDYVIHNLGQLSRLLAKRTRPR